MQVVDFIVLDIWFRMENMWSYIDVVGKYVQEDFNSSFVLFG